VHGVLEDFGVDRQVVERSLGETTDDGGVTLDEVFCLGNCALGPSVQVDGVLRGRVTPARLDAILGDL
jgi:formate dehydrogenase subunit gamma